MSQYNMNCYTSQSCFLTPSPRMAAEERSTDDRYEKRLIRTFIDEASADAEAGKGSPPHTVFFSQFHPF